MKKRLQNGFAHPGLILILLIALAIGLIGYKVFQNNNKIDTTGSSAATAARTVQAINSQADLNSAANSLNSQNIDGDLSPSEYNQDINNLL